MGCTTAKERIESRMLTLKMKRLGIKEEKQKYFDLYERLTGEKLQRKEVPNYIPPEEIQRLKGLYFIKFKDPNNEDNEESEENKKDDNSDYYIISENGNQIINDNENKNVEIIISEENKNTNIKNIIENNNIKIGDYEKIKNKKDNNDKEYNSGEEKNFISNELINNNIKNANKTDDSLLIKKININLMDDLIEKGKINQLIQDESTDHTRKNNQKKEEILINQDQSENI